MKALTLIQPWATAIISLGKDIENRPWAPPKAMIGQRFAIHAGAKFDRDDAWDLQDELGEAALDQLPAKCILGTVVLKGFVTVKLDGTVESHGLTDAEVTSALASKWRSPGAPCLWVVTDPVALPTPIPAKGMLGLWEVLAEHLAAIEVAHG